MIKPDENGDIFIKCKQHSLYVNNFYNNYNDKYAMCNSKDLCPDFTTKELWPYCNKGIIKISWIRYIIYKNRIEEYNGEGKTDRINEKNRLLYK